MHALISYEKRTAPISKDLFSDRDENRYQSSQDTKLRLGAGRRADPGALSPVLHKKEQTSSLYPGLVPGSGRSSGEGIGYPLHYSWASLVAQTVTNLPVMQETWVHSLGQESLLEKGMSTHSCSCLGNFMDRGSLVSYSPWGCRLGE